MAAEDVRVCEPGGAGGLFLGRSKWEQTSNHRVRALVYLTALLYCFLGVNVAADYFMRGVERITTARRRVLRKGTDRYRTETVWNKAIGDLTLLALGSSAPEILLSCIEVTGNGFYSGALGPGTIVGSAAFNLFCIVAVCIYSVPDNEVRAIDNMSVYHVTVIFSMLAYLWLLIIVDVISPDIIELWEAMVTLILFFILLVVAYVSDRGGLGWLGFDRRMKMPRKGEILDGESPGQPLSNMQELADAPRATKSSVHPRVRKSQANLGYGPKMIANREEVDEDKCKADRIKMQQCIQERGHPDGAKEDGLIYDGDKPIENKHGVVTFWRDFVDIEIRHNPIDYEVEVVRRNGYQGKVTVNIRSSPLTATPDRQYHEVDKTLVFADQECSKTVSIRLKPMRSNQLNTSFQLILSDITGGAEFNPNNDGNRSESFLTFNLKNAHYSLRGNKRRMDSFIERFVKPDNLFYGFEMWLDQIITAFSVDGGGDDGVDEGDEEDEDGDAPSASAYIMHVVMFPWKILFAFASPPACWWSGRLLFFTALIYIGIVTALISDLASLFGCCVQLSDEVTAITIVALGTSLPDTFASIAAAKEDDNADSSVVNVTGSNSVNVYVGLGLPWTVAAIYWAITGRTEAWEEKYPIATNAALYELYGGGVFVIHGGNLGYSVFIFLNLAIVALVVLRVRRLRCGGELGGPRRQKLTSMWLLLILWVVYIACSVAHMGMPEEFTKIVKFVIGCVTVVAVLIGMFFECRGPAKYEDVFKKTSVKVAETKSLDKSAFMILKAPLTAKEGFREVVAITPLKTKTRTSRSQSMDDWDHEREGAERNPKKDAKTKSPKTKSLNSGKESPKKKQDRYVAER